MQYEKQADFNSIKVQLKLCILSANIEYFTLFQFHKGTIKTHIVR